MTLTETRANTCTVLPEYKVSVRHAEESITDTTIHCPVIATYTKSGSPAYMDRQR